MIDASTITAAATFGDSAARWLDSGHAGTMTIWIMFLGCMWMLYRQGHKMDKRRNADFIGLSKRMDDCENQHRACEDGRKNLAFCLVAVIEGNTAEAKERAQKAVDEYRSGT